MQKIKPLNNRVAIKPDEYNNTYTLKDGRVILIDMDFDQQEYEVISGTYLEGPAYLRLLRYNPNRFVDKINPNSRIGDKKKLEYLRVENPLQEGDKVYFHFNAFAQCIDGHLMVEKHIKKGEWNGHRVEKMFVDPGEDFYLSSLQVFERDGVVQPLFDTVLAERVYEEEKTTPSGIIINALDLDKPKDKVARIVKIGTYQKPWDYQMEEIKEGDLFIYGKHADFEIKVGDKEYLFMSNDDVLAVVDERTEVH